MSEASKSRWVVLLQKAPRGPLNQDEVRALIDQGLLRMNDLAMEIPSAPSDGIKSDWKLLWQFPEFNRRTGERRRSDAAATPGSTDPGAPPTEQRKRIERRGPEISPEEQKRRVLENLPPEIAAIDPADLALRSVKATVRATGTEIEEPRTSLPSTPPQTPRWGVLVTVTAGALAAVIAVGLLATRTPDAPPSRAAASTAPAGRPGAPIPAPNAQGGFVRVPRIGARPGARRPNAGLPTGAELKPFDTASLRRAPPPPPPAVSPAAREPEDTADNGEYVAPVRRPRVVRPGAPIPVDRLAEEGDEPDEGNRPQNRRRPSMTRGITGDDDNNGNNYEPEEEQEPGDDF